MLSYLNYELSNNKKHTLNPEDTIMFNKLEAGGFVNNFSLDDKICAIGKLFKRGTFEDSIYNNELYIINDTYGFYSNGWGKWYLCKYKPKQVPVIDYYGSTCSYETKYTSKVIKELELKDIYKRISPDVKKQVEQTLKEAEEKYYKESRKTYYELEVNKDENKIYFYLNYLNTLRFGLLIRDDKYLEIFINGIKIAAKDYSDVSDAITEKINEQIEKYLDLGIHKVSNGYIYNNTYYETFDEVKSIINKEDD